MPQTRLPHTNATVNLIYEQRTKGLQMLKHNLPLQVNYHSNNTVSNKLSPRRHQNDMPQAPPRLMTVRLAADLCPSADGSTHLCWPASCRQPAWYSLGWDRQTDGSQYRLMPPVAGDIKTSYHSAQLTWDKNQFNKRTRRMLWIAVDGGSW